MAPKMAWAFFSLSLSRTDRARKSGRRSNRFLGAIWPSITQWRTPRSVKAEIILESCPTLSQTISSTNPASLGFRLAVEGGGDDAFGALGAGLPGKKQRQRAIARNDANAVEMFRHAQNVAAQACRGQLHLRRLRFLDFEKERTECGMWPLARPACWTTQLTQ